MFWSPKGAALATFTDAYIQAGKVKGATTKSRIFEGLKQAGTGYAIGLGIQYGIKSFTSATMQIFGKDSRLFKPVFNVNAQIRSTAEKMRTKHNYLAASDAINSLKNMKNELQTLRSASARNTTRIQELEKEICQQVATLNGDYYAKWQFKYKQDPEITAFFDRYVQRNYRNMTYDMVQGLKNKGM